MRQSRAIVLLTYAGLMLAVSGCNEATSPTDERAQNALNRNMTLWQDLALTDYDMQQQRSCFCSPESIRLMYIRVRGDEIDAVWEYETLDPVDEALWPLFRPVEGLFDIIQTAIDDRYDDLDVEYHEAFGFPMMMISVDPDRDVADDEITYTSSVFIGRL